MSATNPGLPVAGYRPQTDEAVALVNSNKIMEERVLREIEHATISKIADPRMAALAKTKIEEAFMWFNRAIFKPARVTLPEDRNNEPPTT